MEKSYILKVLKWALLGLETTVPRGCAYLGDWAPGPGSRGPGPGRGRRTASSRTGALTTPGQGGFFFAMYRVKDLTRTP